MPGKPASLRIMCWSINACPPHLLDAMKQALREFYGDDPQQSSDYGRIINRRHFERLPRLP